jgi:lipopolysaccharide export system protein LptA
MSPSRVSLFLVGGLMLASAPVAAQQGCVAGDQGNDLVVTRTIPGSGRITYITRPHFVCEGDVQIWADSAVAYEERGMSHLLGSVRYVTQERELTANEARYFSNEGRLQASGDVVVIDEEQGSEIRNGDLVYLPETDFRDVSEMTVTTAADGERPVAFLTPPPPEAAEPPASPTPYTVVGDRIHLVGSGYFTATGDVEIVRDSLFAYADSAEYDEDGRGLVLVGSARVEGSAYELVGERITMGAPGAEPTEVHAYRQARLTGEDLVLTSAQIFLYLRDDALDRLVALPIVRPPTPEADSIDLVRPVAIVQDFVLRADSLEVTAPGASIERVFAAGAARSVSTARDSLNVERLPDIARNDWLEGDTVLITFAPSADEEGEDMEVDEIVARVGARSLYRLPPNDSAARPGTDPPAVHYVVGREIRITMEDGEIVGMEVQGQTRGAHLEPLRAAPADTAAIDTAAVDTTRIGAGAPPNTTPVDTLASADGAPRAVARGRFDEERGNERESRHEETPWIRP